MTDTHRPTPPTVYGHWESPSDEGDTDHTLVLPLTGIVRLYHHGGNLTVYYSDGRELNLGCVLDGYSETNNDAPNPLRRMDAFMLAHGIPLMVPNEDD